MFSLQMRMKSLPITETEKQAAVVACRVGQAVEPGSSVVKDLLIGEYNRQAEADCSFSAPATGTTDLA
jgi:hypothetical protein